MEDKFLEINMATVNIPVDIAITIKGSFKGAKIREVCEHLRRLSEALEALRTLGVDTVSRASKEGDSTDKNKQIETALEETVRGVAAAAAVNLEGARTHFAAAEIATAAAKAAHK